MLRDADSILAGHRQLLPSSAVRSLIELLLKLLGVNPPDLQGMPAGEEGQWASLVDQTFGHVTLRRLAGEREAVSRLIIQELSAGRPVGLMLQGKSDDGERAWVATGLQQVAQYQFVDLASKFPELGSGEGRFTEKRSLRLEEIFQGQISSAFYGEELGRLPAQENVQQRLGRKARLARLPMSPIAA